jgi:hypothetical protein
VERRAFVHRRRHSVEPRAAREEIMRKRTAVSTLIVILIAIETTVASATVELKQIPVVCFHATAEVQAPATAVWSFMTQGKNFITWCPEWKNPSNASINLNRVGDWVDYTDQWGNNGRSVVTFMVRGKELRVAHEPNKGDFLCQAKMILEPGAKGTTVHYYEQYTDESQPADLEATAKKVAAEMERTLAALKARVEKK